MNDTSFQFLAAMKGLSQAIGVKVVRISGDKRVEQMPRDFSAVLNSELENLGCYFCDRHG